MDPPNGTPSVQEKLDVLDRAGLILPPRKATGLPRYKQYLSSSHGTLYQDIWAFEPGTQGCCWSTDLGINEDVKWLDREAERVGYPTQKPLGLLNRIIETSSNDGDLVLDPFCGCATTMVAAELMDRRWVGIDLSAVAAHLVVQRIREKRNLFNFKDVRHRTTIPVRTDIERLKASTFSERRALKNKLYVDQEGRCNLCHGEFEYGNMDMDHIFPKAKGGQDWVDNFQLLCPRCNKLKKTGTQEEARARLVEMRGIDFTPFDNGPAALPIPRAAERTATYGGHKTHSD